MKESNLVALRQVGGRVLFDFSSASSKPSMHPREAKAVQAVSVCIFWLKSAAAMNGRDVCAKKS